MDKPNITVETAEYRGKRWGNAHGFKGRQGGWIYDSKGAPVCQGWWSFYQSHWQAIETERAK